MQSSLAVRTVSALAVVVGLAAAASAQSSAAPAARTHGLTAPPQLGLRFVENAGQWEGAAAYAARLGPADVAFEPGAIVVRLPERCPPPGPGITIAGAPRREPLSLPGAEVRFVLEGAAVAAPVARDLLPGVHNYYLGSDSSRWRVGLHAWGTLEYREPWHGIALVMHERDGTLHYDVVVEPGADLDAFALRAEGALSARVDTDGSLLTDTPRGAIRQSIPAAWQEDAAGRRTPVAARFVARGGGSAPVFGLAVEGRDPSQRVVIDPGFDLAFVYASFAFPPGDIEFYSVEVDPTTDVPVMAGYDDVNAIVTSYDLVAGVLLWVTIIGGPGGTTVGTDLAFDAAGDIYACGVTDSPALPTTPGVFQFFAPGLGDAWVAHLTPIGGIIELSYLGGLLGSEYGNTAIDIGADGMVTLAGYTESLDFPVGPPFVFDPIYNGGGDVWVMRIAPTLAFPFFSTFLGDVGNEFPGIGGVAVSPEGTVVVGGFTDSAAFPTAAATDPTYGGATDAFLTKLTGPLGALVYSTFRGGAGFDCFNGVGVDDTGAAWGAGYTESAAAGPMGPPGVLDLTYNGAGDALLVKHGPLGGFIWSTWRGGDGVDSAYGIAVDPFGRAHISGTTNSGYAASVVPYPTTPPDGFAPFDLPAGSYDAFVECIGPDGDITSYGSTLNVGGGFDEWFTGIAIGAEGNTLLAGAIAPGPLPLANAPIIRCIMPWGDEENSLTGTTTPQLMGDGTLVAGSPVELRFTNLVPGSLVTLFVGGPLFLPFAGGTLVPAAMIVIGGLPVNPAGQVNLAGVWPPGLPADTLLYMQGWVPDPGSPSGLAATNGVRMWTP